GCSTPRWRVRRRSPPLPGPARLGTGCWPRPVRSRPTWRRPRGVPSGSAWSRGPWAAPHHAGTAERSGEGTRAWGVSLHISEAHEPLDGGLLVRVRIAGPRLFRPGHDLDPHESHARGYARRGAGIGGAVIGRVVRHVERRDTADERGRHAGGHTID